MKWITALNPGGISYEEQELNPGGISYEVQELNPGGISYEEQCSGGINYEGSAALAQV